METTNQELIALIDNRISASTGTSQPAVVTDLAKNQGNGHGLYTVLSIARTYYNCTPTAIFKYLTSEGILVKTTGEYAGLVQSSLQPNLKLSNGGYAIHPDKRNTNHNLVFRPTVSKGHTTSHYEYINGKKVVKPSGYVKWLVDANYEGTRAYFDDIVEVQIPKKIHALKRQLIEISRSGTGNMETYQANKQRLKDIEVAIKEYDMVEIHSDFRPLSDEEAYLY